MGIPPEILAKRYPALVTGAAASFGVPFYLGLIHLPLTQLALYAGFASTAMATGQYFDTPDDFRGGFEAFLSELGLWLGLICIAGGFAYLAALVF